MRVMFLVSCQGNNGSLWQRMHIIKHFKVNFTIKLCHIFYIYNILKSVYRCCYSTNSSIATTSQPTVWSSEVISPVYQFPPFQICGQNVYNKSLELNWLFPPSESSKMYFMSTNSTLVAKEHRQIFCGYLSLNQLYI